MGSIETFTSGAALSVDVAAIEKALTQLWKEAAAPEAGEGAAVTRACLLNLVVWSPAGETERRAVPGVIARVVATHPSRVLLVEIETAGPEDALDAFISAHCHRPSPGARQVCCEQVTFHAGTRSAHHVSALVSALQSADLPVCLYAPGDPPLSDPTFRRLAGAADRIVVDTAGFTGEASLRALAALFSPPNTAALGDVNWRRLRPFQDLIAEIFDGPLFRPVISRISGVEIAAGPGSDTTARLLGGWILAALRGRSLDFRIKREESVPPGGLRSVRLIASGGDAPASFIIECDPATGILTSEVVTSGACPLPRRIRPRPLDPAQLLCGQLEASGRDPLYEAALRNAVALG